MSLPANTGERLEAMGFRSNADFTWNGTTLSALNGTTLPSEAAINAYNLSAGQLAALYTKAKALLTADDAISKKEKAVLLVILDEFNLHADKVNSILTACDNAATFAAFKTAILAINDYPTRTASQIKTSVAAKIDAGQADG